MELNIQIFIALVSIVFIAGWVWIGHRIIPFKLCPICAGVAGTWLWMMTAAYRGYAVDMRVVALMMGGTVVGLAGELEKRIKFRYPLVWKSVFVIGGFWTAFLLQVGRLDLVGLSALSLAVFTYLFSKLNLHEHNAPASENKELSELEKKIEDCC